MYLLLFLKSISVLLLIKSVLLIYFKLITNVIFLLLNKYGKRENLQIYILYLDY